MGPQLQSQLKREESMVASQITWWTTGPNDSWKMASCYQAPTEAGVKKLMADHHDTDKYKVPITDTSCQSKNFVAPIQDGSWFSHHDFWLSKSGNEAIFGPTEDGSGNPFNLP